MAQDGNAILKQILGVCVQINNKLDRDNFDKKEERKSDVGTGSTYSFFTKENTDKIKKSADPIKDILNSLGAFLKIKTEPRKIDRTAEALDKLFNVILKIGEKQRMVDRAISLFESLRESLVEMTPFVRSLNSLLIGIGMAVVGLAAGIFLASKLFGVSPLEVIGVSLLTIAGLTAAIALLGRFEKWIKPGYETAQGIGKALTSLAIGTLAFVTSWKLSSVIIGVGGTAGMVQTAFIILGIIGGLGAGIALLGKFENLTEPGIKSAIGMGKAFGALALGTLSFAISWKLISGILGIGGTQGLVSTAFVIFGIIGGLSAGIVLLGKFENIVDPGIRAAIGMGKAFGALALGTLSFVLSWKLISGILGIGGTQGLVSSAFVIFAIIGGLAAGIALLGKFENITDPGQKTAQGIGKALGILAIGTLGFVLSWKLISKLLGGDGMLKSIFVITGILVGMTAGIALLGRFENMILPGSRSAAGIGKALGILAVGTLAFAGSWKLVSMMLGAGDGMGKAAFVIIGIIAGMTAGIALLGRFENMIEPGVRTASGIGKTLGILAIGTLGFVLSWKLISKLLGGEGMIKPIFIITGILAGMTAGMALLGKFEGIIAPGIRAAAGIGKALGILAVGTLAFVGSWKLISMMLGAGDNMGKSAFIIMGIIAGMSAGISLLGRFESMIEPGVRTASGIGKALGILSLGTLSFAVTWKLTSMMLESGGMGKAAFAIMGIIAGLSAGIALLGKFENIIDPGIRTAAGIGKAFGILSLGTLAFVSSWKLISKMLGAGDGMGKAILSIIGIIAGLSGTLFLLGLGEKWIRGGINTAQGMGKAFGILAVGTLGFAISWKLISTILGGGTEGMGRTALSIIGIIAALSGGLAILGIAERWIKSGIDVSKGMGKALGILALGTIGFVLSWKLISTILGGTEGMGKTAFTIIGIIAVMSGGLAILGLAKRWIKDGIEVSSGIGKTLGILAIGTLGFVLSWKLISSILGTGGGMEGISKAGFTIVGVIAVMAGVMGLLGFAKRWVDAGIDTAKGMGVAMAALAIGVLAFVGSWKLISIMLGSGGGMKGMGAGALVIVGVIAAFAGIFALLGVIGPVIRKGTSVAWGMAGGMAALALGVLVFAGVAKLITGLAGGKEDYDKRTKFGQLMSEIGPGLGVMGIVIVSMGLLFAGLGALSAVIIPGVIAGLLMAGGMILFAIATKKLVTIAKELGDPKEVRTAISGMISGAFGGLLDGVSGTLSGGESGIKGFINGIKNTGIIMAGIGLLMGVSVALSMFAKAMTAFATLDNMRVIKSYDEKTGEPRFGETVNVAQVGHNISTTITTFLRGLIDATDGLTRREAGAIKKMSRALTGRRGILSGVIQFADVLKTYAEFGKNNEVGWVELVPDGVDEDGNEKYKKVRHKTPVVDVVENINKAFGLFVTNLASKANEYGIDGRERRKLKRLSQALTGRNGILEPIIDFTKAIDSYARYGSEGVIAVTDENGKVIKKVPIADIAKNVASVLSSFSAELAVALENTNARDSRKAGRSLKDFDSMITQLGKISKSTERLDETALALSNFAKSIGELSESINKFDIEKLAAFAEINSKKKIGDAYENINAAVAEKESRRETRQVEMEERREERIQQPTPIQTTQMSEPVQTAAVQSKIKEQTPPPAIDVDELANKIGSAVSMAFKSGHFNFEFATDKSGVLTFD